MRPKRQKEPNIGLHFAAGTMIAFPILFGIFGYMSASTTAFTVNSAHFLPWWAQWFGPTLLLVPFQFYFARKVRALRTQSLAKKVAA